jgi:uncharacterized protein (DUF433 family)
VAILVPFDYNDSQEITTMGLVIAGESVPLQVTEDGVVRVGGTRVTLDTVVTAFEEGATAEEIVQQYPSLALGDAYAVIGYYLGHRREVEGYLGQRRDHSSEIRRQNTAHFDLAGVRARLLARRSE